MSEKPSCGAARCTERASALILRKEESELKMWTCWMWVRQKQTELQCLHFAPGHPLNVTVLRCPRMAASAMSCHVPSLAVNRGGEMPGADTEWQWVIPAWGGGRRRFVLISAPYWDQSCPLCSSAGFIHPFQTTAKVPKDRDLAREGCGSPQHEDA